MKRAALFLFSAVCAGPAAAQVPHPDSASLMDQAVMIAASGASAHDRTDAAVVRLAVVFCSQSFPADSIAARARCFLAAQSALSEILVRVGPCSRNVRTDRDGKRECWRLVNDTWSWAPMFDADTAK